MQAVTLFLKSAFRDPARAGSIAPSSSALARRMASLVRKDGSHVLEIGAGTGAFTRALIAHGIPSCHLWAVELDPALASFLEQQMPRVNVICGDALHLCKLLPPSLHGRIGTVVSGVPMRNLNRRERRETATSMIEMLQPSGDLLQFTYGLRNPLEVNELALTAERIGRVWRNLPPAAIWRYRRI